MSPLHIIVCVILTTWNFGYVRGDAKSVSAKKSKVWGPGLRADFLVPVRYFYIQLVSKDGTNVTEPLGEEELNVDITTTSGNIRPRIWKQVLDFKDGLYLVRYRPFSSSADLQISIQVKGRHIADSPYHLKGNIYHETCDCPHQTADEWAESIGCPATYKQIDDDLRPFHDLDMDVLAKEAVKRFHDKGKHSICHYQVIKNKVYRKCYGEHVGFKMFSDAILLSLTRKMYLPDFEFFMNLGDWPLDSMAFDAAPLPVFSWCGSHQTRDIVIPTYDITEATLEMMGRVSLDMFSVQANTGPRWENKTDKAFFRGRDSRRERLNLVELSLKQPDFVDARLTNMFFFKKDEEKYGEVVKQISFFDFFKFKYQLNIDGTVAAYRFPYLLAGDAVVFKQKSDYYEHFYSDLKPGVHYVPIKSDLSDLIEKIKLAREHDEEFKQIAMNGQQYAREHLTPADILCYHVRVFQKYSKLLKKKPKLRKGFEWVEQPEDKAKCSCKDTNGKGKSREEL